jgi:hypothetical protein
MQFDGHLGHPYDGIVVNGTLNRADLKNSGFESDRVGNRLFESSLIDSFRSTIGVSGTPGAIRNGVQLRSAFAALFREVLRLFITQP